MSSQISTPATNHGIPFVVPPTRSAPETIKVLHVINGEHYSGAERVQDLLGMRLPEFGFAPSFATLCKGRFLSERQSQACPLYPVPMQGKLDQRPVRAIRKLVEEQGYQVLHAHTPRSLLVASLVARKTGIPLVYHVHSPVSRDSTRRLSNWINLWAERLAARRVDHFVCVSHSLRAYMGSLGYPDDMLTTVANGVAALPSVGERPAPGATWTVGTTALFRPRKGTEVLLQALAMLKQDGIPVRLLAVGPFESSDYETAIKTQARELGIADLIEWTGFTRDVDSQFQRMDLFVLPSLFGEGLPMVVLEAMANGVPVVAADVEGIPEAVRSGTDGLIFRAGDASALAASITQFVNRDLDWNAVRAAVLQRQRDSFSDASMAEGVAGVYRKVLDLPAPSQS